MEVFRQYRKNMKITGFQLARMYRLLSLPDWKIPVMPAKAGIQAAQGQNVRSKTYLGEHLVLLPFGRGILG